MSVEEEAKSAVRKLCGRAFNRGDLGALTALLTEAAEIQGVIGKGTFERVEPIWRQLIEGYGMFLLAQ
jgi:hypothetical protein